VTGIRRGLVLAFVCLPLFAGCGSGSSPPFAVSCTVRHLATGRVRANVTITNQTSAAGNAIIFSPVLINLRRFYPVVLLPTRVVVDQQHGQTSYIAFVVPHVRPKAPSHVLLTFQPPRRAQSLAVTATRVIQAGDSSPLDNPDCVIR
jgi:hypothetical protein